MKTANIQLPWKLVLRQDTARCPLPLEVFISKHGEMNRGFNFLSFHSASLNTHQRKGSVTEQLLDSGWAESGRKRARGAVLGACRSRRLLGRRGFSAF